jgi:8-oxo-dGTP diphosphatase
MRVVAGVLLDDTGRVLIAQRPHGSWQAGRWEFPGGKVESGETDEQALRRELKEELGIHVQQARLLQTVEHAYSDRTVSIALWLVPRYEGTPQGLDAQALQWRQPQELHSVDLLEADLPFIATLENLV